MQTPDEILNKSPWFKQMLARLKRQLALQERFYNLVGSPYQDKCQVSRFQDGILYLVTSAAWSSRIYYDAPRIIANLKKDPAFAGIEGLRCSVAPVEVNLEPAPEPTKGSLKREKMPINANVAEALSHCAESVTDPELKKALERLAARGKL